MWVHWGRSDCAGQTVPLQLPGRVWRQRRLLGDAACWFWAGLQSWARNDVHGGAAGERPHRECNVCQAIINHSAPCYAANEASCDRVTICGGPCLNCPTAINFCRRLPRRKVLGTLELQGCGNGRAAKLAHMVWRCGGGCGCWWASRLLVRRNARVGCLMAAGIGQQPADVAGYSLLLRCTGGQALAIRSTIPLTEPIITMQLCAQSRLPTLRQLFGGLS